MCVCDAAARRSARVRVPGRSGHWMRLMRVRFPPETPRSEMSNAVGRAGERRTPARCLRRRTGFEPRRSHCSKHPHRDICKISRECLAAARPVRGTNPRPHGSPDDPIPYGVSCPAPAEPRRVGFGDPGIREPVRLYTGCLRAEMVQIHRSPLVETTGPGWTPGGEPASADSPANPDVGKMRGLTVGRPFSGEM